MNRKLQLRTLFGVTAVAALFWIMQWLIHIKQDPDFGNIQTTNWIAAVQTESNGKYKAVIIKPDGTKLLTADNKKSATDHDLVWQSDGGRLFFISNRDRKAFDIYRWNLAKNILERRTFDNRPKSDLSFRDTQNKNKGLLISGATILQFNPKTGSMQQILPQLTADPKLLAFYQKYVQRFLKARSLNEGNLMIVLAKEEDGHHHLMVQDLTKTSLPAIIASGKFIDFDAHASGKILYAIQSDDGLSQLLLFDDETGQKNLIYQSKSEEMTTPRLSQSLGYAAVQLASSRSLALLSIKEGRVVHFFDQTTTDASWHPYLDLLLYTKKVGVHGNAIFVYDATSKSEKRITYDEAEYQLPQFSPAR